MINAILLRIICIVVPLYLSRRLSNIPVGKGDATMKLTATVKGLDLNLSVNDVVKLRDTAGNITHVQPQSIFNGNLKIDESVNTVEMSDEEFKTGRECVERELKNAREFAAPLLDKLMDKISAVADRGFDIFEAKMKTASTTVEVEPAAPAQA